jgi:hypothetical protein
MKQARLADHALHPLLDEDALDHYNRVMTSMGHAEITDRYSWGKGDGLMEAANLIRDIGSLPPEAQKQVFDFVAFLKTRYLVVSVTRKTKRTKLADEPFIGKWRDRDDMQDSNAWVRRLRESEWTT